MSTTTKYSVGQAPQPSQSVDWRQGSPLEEHSRQSRRNSRLPWLLGMASGLSRRVDDVVVAIAVEAAVLRASAAFLLTLAPESTLILASTPIAITSVLPGRSERLRAEGWSGESE